MCACAWCKTPDKGVYTIHQPQCIRTNKTGSALACFTCMSPYMYHIRVPMYIVPVYRRPCLHGGLLYGGSLLWSFPLEAGVCKTCVSGRVRIFLVQKRQKRQNWSWEDSNPRLQVSLLILQNSRSTPELQPLVIQFYTIQIIIYTKTLTARLQRRVKVKSINPTCNFRINRGCSINPVCNYNKQG